MRYPRYRQTSELERIRKFRDNYIKDHRPLQIGDIVKIKPTNKLGYVTGFSAYGLFIEDRECSYYTKRDDVEFVER